MKTIELSTGTLLVVALPEDELTPMGVDLNGFDFLGHPSEITGEVWGKVCEQIHVEEAPSPYNEMSGGWHMDYVDYNNPGEYAGWQGDAGSFRKPLKSGLSLCAAHNIQESDVLLFKPKAESSNPNDNPDGYHHETGRNEA